MKIRFIGGVVCCLFILSGCATQAPKETFSATLWMQNAAEYRALGLQAYQTASALLETAVDDTSWTAALEQTENYEYLRPAVILDIDETTLDNSPYDGRLILDHVAHDEAFWEEWVAMAAARPVPGVIDFLEQAKAMGVSIIYITNRKCQPGPGDPDTCPQKTATLANLKKAGFPAMDAQDRLLLRNEQPDWGSEKQTRRESVVDEYRILMMFGDDLGDFIPAVRKNITAERRKELVDTYMPYWGTRWFVLPNPVYGSWYNILPDPKIGNIEGYKK